MDWKYLVILDIGKIHEYIFGTNKLREIRGASILLDTLNRENALIPLKKKGVNEKWKCIISNGGITKVLFKNEGEAEKYREYLKELYYKEAAGIDLSLIVSKKKESWSEEDWIDQAERELQRKKLCKELKMQALTSAYFKTCQACGLYPVEERDHERFVCRACFQKIKKAKQYTEMRIYKRLFKSIDLDKDKLPQEFSDIGKKSTPEGYIGFIYADGNRMGKHLERIKTFDKLKEFSNKVDNATIEAAVTAVKNNFSDDPSFQIILAGGDDLIMAVPANKAMSVALDYCKEFNDMLKEDTKEDNVTTSAAVVLCHDSLPIKHVLESAEGLLRNAKKKGKMNQSYIDFLATSGSTLEDPVSTRKKELEYRDYKGTISLSMRPYPVGGLKELCEIIKDMKKKDFPGNKLKALHGSLFKGYSQAIIEALYLRTRLKIKKDLTHYNLIKQIQDNFSLDNFPWKEISVREYETPMVDLIELYEFIQK